MFNGDAKMGENNPDNSLVVFEGKKIRRTWYEDKWHFSVVDIIQVLTGSPTPRQYWGKVKDREFNTTIPPVYSLVVK